MGCLRGQHYDSRLLDMTGRVYSREIVLTLARHQTAHYNRTRSTDDLLRWQLFYRHRGGSSYYKCRNKLFHIGPSSNRNWRNLWFKFFG
jgi:hypothetical protein